MQATQNEFKPEWKSNMPDIRMQGEDDKKENDAKEDVRRLLEQMREQRMQEMFGEVGREGYVGEFMKGLRQLKKTKEELNFAQTKPDHYDEETERLHRKISKIKGQPGEKEFQKSINVTEARARLRQAALDLELLRQQTNLDEEGNDEIKNDVKNAEKIFKTPEDLEHEIENTREKLAESYVNIVHSSLDEIDELNKFLDLKKNAYPYDSRWSIDYFKRALQSVNDKLRNKDKYEEEGLALAKMLKTDMLWAFSSAKMMEAMGPAYEMYFDGELELSRIRSTHTELLSDDFVRVFKDKLPGIELSDSEKSLVKNTLSKIKNTEDAERYANLNSESLRDVAVRYQDEFGYWLYATVAAGQENMESNSATDKEAGEHYMKLSEEERLFLVKVFDAGKYDKDVKEYKNTSGLIYVDENGNEHKVVENIYNPFCMPRNDSDANKQYLLRMHELVINSKKYKDSIKKISDDFSNKAITELDRERLIAEEVDKVLGVVNDRLSKWETLEDNNIYDRLGFTVIKELTNLERGTLACGDLGWRWRYEEVKLTISKYDKDGREYVEVNGNKVYKDKVKEDEWNIYTHFLFDGGNRNGAEIYYKADKDTEKIIKKDLLPPKLRSYVENNLLHGVAKRTQFDKDGNQVFVKRVSELGSIYDNHDVTTVAFWARHIVDYDKYADTRSSLLFPTIGWYRERWESEPPYFRPELSEFAAQDTVLNGRLEKMLSSNNPLAEVKGRHIFIKGEKGLQEQKLGNFDPKVAKFIKDNVWAFVTPWLNEPGKGQGEYYLSVPVFLPTYLPDVNFWRCFTLERPSTKMENPQESIWHKRLRREKLSEMKWENMDTYKYSWGLVNHDQIERWFGPWITPHKFNRATEGEVEKHLAIPSGTSDKESGKRYRLGLRAGILDAGVVRASSSAQNKILAAAQFGQVLGMKIDSLKNIISPNTIDLNEKLNIWRNDWVAPWVNSLLDMPYEVRNVKNYPGTAAQCAIFTYLQVRRIVESGIISSYGQKSSVIDSLSTIEKSF